MVSTSIGLKVARSMTSQLMPWLSSSATARSVSMVMAPHVTMLTSLPSRKMKQCIQRQRLAIVGHFLAHRPVQAHRLEEHHRVGIADRGQQQTIGACRRGRADDANPGNVAKQRLGAFRMVFRRVDAAAVRRADDHRAAQAAARAIAHARHVIHDLIERRIHESHELNFRNRLQPVRRHAHRHAGDRGLRQRRVLHAILAESALQSRRSRETRRRSRRHPARSPRRCRHAAFPSHAPSRWLRPWLFLPTQRPAGFRAVLVRSRTLLAQVQRQFSEQVIEHRVGRLLGRMQILAHRGIDLLRALLQQRLLLRFAPRRRP